MMGTKARAFSPLCNRSLETLVPTDQFYRHLHTTLDLTFVRALVCTTYKEWGRPSIDPIIFFKLQLVMFFEGIRSERELVRVAADRLGLRWYLGYDLDDDHYAVDGGSARIILEVLVTLADVMENQPFLGLLWRACCRRRSTPRQVAGDTTYRTVENIVAVEDQGIRASVPRPDFYERTEFYGASKFTYEPDGDQYRCPHAHVLRCRWVKYTEGTIV
jgi:hypothetical protein